MKESKVSAFDETIVYEGVNLGGQSAWNQNAAERSAGLPRVIPEEYLRPKDPNMSWATYRGILAKAGVKDSTFTEKPSYCHYGDTTTVP